MFTGIVDHRGTIETVTTGSDRVARLDIACAFTDLVLGESISVDGCCLTVSQINVRGFRCDLSSETLARTLARGYRVGSPVNLERALRFGDRLGGHMVTGHIEGVGKVFSKLPEADFVRLEFTAPPGADLRALVPKGSIAVNGVSLTLNEVVPESGRFSVMVIPHTLERTNLSGLNPGDPVNLELDWMTKIILHDAERRRAGIEESRWKD